MTALLLSASPAFALFGMSDRQDGGQAGSFLRAAVSARPLGMGGAFTAIADDASAPFWNASGLSQLQRFDAVTYYSRLGDDANIGSAAFAVPTPRLGTFSLNYVGLQSGGFARRDASNQDLGTFRNDASALLLSQGVPISTRFAAGYTVKALRETIAGFSGTGYGADVGFMYRPAVRWQAGLAVENLLRPSVTLKDDAETLPTAVRLGGRFDPVPRVTLGLDTSVAMHRAAEFALGAEWRAASPLALRVGANEQEMSAGVGFFFGNAGLDYAFGFPVGAAVREEIGTAQRFSFHLSFGPDVQAGSYRDLARRRDEQKQELAREDVGLEQVKALEKKMPDWNGRMDLETFNEVQAARQSLRSMAFKNPDESLQAQAYILHFEGRFPESVRIFDQLETLHPGDARIRRDAETARRRMDENPNFPQIAAAYDKMEEQEHTRQEKELADARTVRLAEARAFERQAREAQKSVDAQEAGGAGQSAAATERGGGATDREQLAFAPPMMPVTPPRPIAKPIPVAKPVPVEKPAVTNPPSPAAVPKPVEPAAAPTDKREVAQAERLFKQGDYTCAYVMSKRALAKDPNDLTAARQAILASAVASAEATITDPTAKVDETAIAAQVDRSLAIYKRGLAARRQGRRDEALALMDEAVQACPANYLAREQAQAMSEQAEDERTQEIIDRARRDGSGG